MPPGKNEKCTATHPYDHEFCPIKNEKGYCQLLVQKFYLLGNATSSYRSDIPNTEPIFLRDSNYKNQAKTQNALCYDKKYIEPYSADKIENLQEFPVQENIADSLNQRTTHL